jgi:hypothetical protein
MSSARLEIIKDSVELPPAMSRKMPAALDGLVGKGPFTEFCDALDATMELLFNEQRRRMKRFCCMCGGIYLWFMFFNIFASLVDIYSLLGSVALCAVHLSTVWMCTSRPAGTPTAPESMRKIRAECDRMTTATPHVSFSIVLVPTPAAARGAWLQMDNIDHIGVSVSLTAHATGSATASFVPAANIIMADAKADDSNATTAAVAFAQAVPTNTGRAGAYQPIRTEDVEMV